ncbi:sugar transferase [Cellulomonas sp. ATA003]|uniref:sugar transferase n=1 Tax=Cellulomonas sp. ATA003 TaxID=3073064 RepID=UPI002873D21B|nr:sugar transferase [Cellulomonas sp. ATA003]WNB85212.1 sugar transferase [Cellulomonas sp. ATA003]
MVETATVEAARGTHVQDGPEPAPLLEGRGRESRWWSGYLTRVLVTDAVAIWVAVFAAYVIRFDAIGTAWVSGDLATNYLVVSVVLMWAWLAALVVGRTQDRRLVGTGPAEYQRVVGVTWRLFAAVAVLAFLLRMEIARGYLALALPLGLALLLAGRLGWRQWLRSRRRDGAMTSRVLVVGHRDKAEALIRELAIRRGAGFAVAGVCLPTTEQGESGALLGVPVVGTFDDAAAMARELGADAVAVTGSDAATADTVRRLGWDLEGSGIDLALAVSLTDVAGPRVLMQPVNGLPLIYVDEPRFSGTKYALKSTLDWVLALGIVLALSPVLAVIAVLVKTTSQGPVIYRQHRVGRNGETFAMFKFRSMDANAHLRLQEVMGDDVGLFYKSKNDPRVTPLGRVLRRYSLDELPQLFNVLRGEMSLVGPRPQIDREVAQYDRKAHRRLLVKPGLTGLWQVSGRSELTPEESIRMDVYYVENWTLFGDLAILARTVRAVFGSEGAY